MPEVPFVNSSLHRKNPFAKLLSQCALHPFVFTEQTVSDGIGGNDAQPGLSKEIQGYGLPASDSASQSYHYFLCFLATHFTFSKKRGT
jgi:hypothetical protein